MVIWGVFNRGGKALIKLSVLGSGSAGNSTFIDIDGRKYLIDCGFTKIQTKKRLESIGRSIEEIEGVLVSHDHKDHTSPWLIKDNMIITELAGTPFDSFQLSHDAPCLGYTAIDKDGNKVGIVSDTGCIPEEAIGKLFDCAVLLVETNYSIELLVESPYSTDMQERIASNVGHLRSECAAELVEMVAWDGLRYVIGIHLSKTNNHPDLVRFCLTTAAHGTYAEVIISQQHEPTKMMVVM